MFRYDYLKRVESSARTYAAAFNRVLTTGRGMRLYDESGREVLDCLSCAGALPLGHNDPEVTGAVLEFLSSGHPQQALDLTTPAKYEFVKELLSCLPPAFSARARIQFCSPSGSDAVEAALKLARYATGRRTVMAFHGAYHGMTAGALAAMGNLSPKTGVVVGDGGVHFAPFPHRFHCPFGSDGTDTDRLSINYLRTLLTDPESGVTKPAAVIVEVVQGEGGCVPVSDTWLRALRDLTREHGVLLIVDEVQTGFGRTGSMFAFERAGIVPDILVLSKALGGGYPLAVIVYDESLDGWPRGIHAGTFRGNQIGMVAGRATLGIIRRDGLAERAARTGELLAGRLRELAARWPFLVDVRGRGLMVGVQVVRGPKGSLPDVKDGEVARAVKLNAFEEGLLIETGGRHGSVLRLLPPLVMTDEDVAIAVERLDVALGKTVRQGGLDV
jgi:diaminobutyrate-2-oxoglutarate transaminase